MYSGNFFVSVAVFFIMQSATQNTQLFTIWYLNGYSGTTAGSGPPDSVDVIILCFEILCFEVAAMVILYIGFSLYNCLEKTTQTVWKTSKTQGISFCQICKHPVIINNQHHSSPRPHCQLGPVTCSLWIKLVQQVTNGKVDHTSIWRIGGVLISLSVAVSP